MDAPKGLGALGSQKNAIIAAVAAVAIPLSLFIYLDASKKSRALNDIEQSLVKAEQAADKKDYIKSRDYLDKGASLHLSLKFRNRRWEVLAERIKTMEARINKEEAPFTYEQFLQEAAKHLEAGEYPKAQEALKNAKDTAALNRLYNPPFNIAKDEYEALSAKVDLGLKRARMKALARELAEAYEQKLFSKTWELVREADAMGLEDDQGGDEEYKKAKAEEIRIAAALKALVQEKKDQGFILVENAWLPIRDHALNRIRYMRGYAIETDAPEADAAILKETISRVFAVIVPGLGLATPPAEGEEPRESERQADLIVRVRDVKVQTGAGGTFQSDGVFEFFEPKAEVTIWRLAAHVNSDAYRGPTEEGVDARTNALKSMVKDVFYKDFFKELPEELRKKTNQDYANIQRP